ncbi:hypothetical protein [Methanobrevibacter filiformis]|uniref:SpoVT-AbrB domain-containing protein n=1 Tax=Methanobrevibacter filiformis TaxID=55758 RepID=A0A166A4E7_9EURY|nr:hypothetical protein [Methanobrevibacter filiformis]KZX11548.1 hypothetical protein MBFIL_14240 [Methanobrevibacter filiformis]
MIATSKMYDKYQIVIPAKIRKEIGINDIDHIVEWDVNENKEVVLNFRKKITLNDVLGAGKTIEPTNAVKLKKKVACGEKILRD